MARGSNGEISAMGESLTKQCRVELYLPRAGMGTAMCHHPCRRDCQMPISSFRLVATEKA